MRKLNPNLSHIPSKKHNRRAFTLVELLVALFIFSIVIAMSSSSFVTAFVAGRSSSTQSKQTTRDMNFIFSIIGQKMADANAQAKVNSDIVYGFKVIDNMLVIVGTYEQTTLKCTFIKYDEPTLYAVTQNGDNGEDPKCGDIPAQLIAESNKISSSNLEITGFSFPEKYEFVKNTNIAPYLTVKITAKDGEQEINMQSTYTLELQTLQKFKKSL